MVGIHGADYFTLEDAGIMMVEITVMQHKGVNGNVHHTPHRLQRNVRSSRTLVALLRITTPKEIQLQSDCLV